MSSARQLVRRARAEARARRLAAGARRDLTPPPPSAFAAYGAGTIILPPARVQLAQHVSLGSGVVLHEHTWLCLQQVPGQPAPRLTIGDRTSFNRFCKIVCVADVTIGRDCLIGDGVYIADTAYTNTDPEAPVGRQPLEPPRPVHVGDGVLLGVRAIVNPGVTIGEHASIGAAAVVSEDVPPYCVAVGNPARIVRHYDRAAGEWRSGAPS